jgi:hypothetical protein
MKDSDLNEFTEIMDDLAEMLGGDMSPRKYELYFAALSDLSIEEIRKAANQIARKAIFFPKPVDFRNASQGDQETRIMVAWEKVLKGKSKAGKIQSVQFDDPVIHSAIVMMGGWSAVCNLEGFENEKWQRLEFEKVYKAMMEAKDHPKYLPGSTEIQNLARGYEEKADLVLIGGHGVKLLKNE